MIVCGPSKFKGYVCQLAVKWQACRPYLPKILNQETLTNRPLSRNTKDLFLRTRDLGRMREKLLPSRGVLLLHVFLSIQVYKLYLNWALKSVNNTLNVNQYLHCAIWVPRALGLGLRELGAVPWEG